MTSNNENNEALQQALATIAAQGKTIDTQQKTIDAQGKLLAAHANSLSAQQEHATTQGKTIGNLEQRIQQLEEALRKSTTRGGYEAQVNSKRSAAKPSMKVPSVERTLDEIDKESLLLEEYYDAYYDYYGLDKSDEARHERLRAGIESFRSEGKGAGARRAAALKEQTQALVSRSNVGRSSDARLTEDTRSDSPWSRLSTASSSTMK